MRRTPQTPEFAGESRQLRAVGGQRDLLKCSRFEMPGQGTEQPHDVAADEGLPAGDAYLARPHLDERRAEAIQLLKRQEFASGQKRHLLRHAVGAAKIATICDRHANVSDRSSKRVHEGRTAARPDRQLIRHARSH
jgi:hypothetical protein